MNTKEAKSLAQILTSHAELLEALKDAINFITLGLNNNPIELQRFLKMKQAIENAEK